MFNLNKYEVITNIILSYYETGELNEFVVNKLRICQEDFNIISIINEVH